MCSGPATICPRSHATRPGARSAWQAGTARSLPLQRSRSNVTCRSCACPSALATTSPETSASTATTRSAALAAFADGVETRVDVGRAGDRLFLNNVSLGVYARLVHRREHHRRRSDALARLRGLAILVTERHAARLTVDGTPARRPRRF